MLCRLSGGLSVDSSSNTIYEECMVSYGLFFISFICLIMNKENDTFLLLVMLVLTSLYVSVWGYKLFS